MTVRVRRFLGTVAVLWLVAFLVGALLAPPDPFTQLLFAGPLVLAAIPLAYWLAHGGYAALGVRPPSPWFTAIAVAVCVSFAAILVRLVLVPLGVPYFLRQVVALTVGLSVAGWLVLGGGDDALLAVVESFRSGE